MTCEEIAAAFKSEAGAHLFFQFGAEVRERADRAGKLADPHVLRRHRSNRAMSRWTSEYQLASLNPNVIGSA